jgi:hypothetical protein
MKILPKGIFFPIGLLQSPQLTWTEKAAMAIIDAAADDPLGARVSPVTLSHEMNITQKEAKEVLNSLSRKGAVEASVDEDGETRLLALLYKESYDTDEDKKDIIKENHERHDYDYDEIQRQWNQNNPNLPQMARLTPKRKRQIRNVLTQNALSVDALYKAFRIISVSDFLQGKNQSKWQATADWLFKKTENIEKVLAGNYCSSPYEKQCYASIMSGEDTKFVTEEEDIYK